MYYVGHGNKNTGRVGCSITIHWNTSVLCNEVLIII